METQANNTSGDSSASGSDIVGKITAIDGDQITLALGTLAQAEKPQMPDNDASTDASPDSTSSATAGEDSQQEPPEGGGPGGQQGGDNSDSANQQPPSVSGAPEGNADSMPSGAPEGADGGPGGMGGGTFTESGEEKTITVTDNTVITLAAMGGPDGGREGTSEQSSSGTSSASETGAISDLAVGDIITVTLSGNTATAISVRPSGGVGGSLNGQQGGNSENGEASDNTASPETSAADDTTTALSNTANDSLGVTESGTLAHFV